MHPGEIRAEILETVARLLDRGLTMREAVRQVQQVDRTTVYRWAQLCKGRPRAEWGEILQSKRLKSHPETHRARVWRSMRILKRFTYSDLQATAETSRRNISNYVGSLHEAGYLHKRRGTRQHASEVVWMLARDTGPNPPRVLRDGRVFDPNTNTVAGGRR